MEKSFYGGCIVGIGTMGLVDIGLDGFEMISFILSIACISIGFIIADIDLLDF